MVRGDGRWCDVTTVPSGGAMAWVYQRETVVVCENAESGAPFWELDAKREMLYLRCAADNDWRICAIGVGQDDQAAIVIDGQNKPILLGRALGNYAVEIEGLKTGGWRAFVQRTATTYDEIVLRPDGTVLSTTKHMMPATSQGFLDIRDGVLITSDAGRLEYGLVLPNMAGTAWAGQLPNPNGLAIYDASTGRPTTLFMGDSQPPHIGEDSAGAFYVCAWRPEGAWVERYTRPFAAGPGSHT
jgi:hypothetical protein